MLEAEFPLYTMHAEGNVFVKHISRSKCIVVSSWLHAPSIERREYNETVFTHYFDEFTDGEAQPIPKARFDIERQQVILQLIHG